MVWIVWWWFSVLQEFRKEKDLGRIGLGRAPLSQSVVTSSVVWIRGESMVCSAKEAWQARHEAWSRDWSKREVHGGVMFRKVGCGMKWEQWKEDFAGSSLVKNLLAPVQGTWFHLWSGKILHATGQISLCATTTEAHVARACALQQEKPLRWEIHAAQLARVSLTSHN